MNPAGAGGAAGPPAPGQLTLIVDGANVMGSRANGWWRDRAGAMARLHDELVVLAAHGIAVPPPSGGDATGQPAIPWFPHILLVVEGKSRAVAGLVTADPRVEVVLAPAEGDDEIARLAGGVPGRRIVITADQALRGRSTRAGAEVAGPRWLTGLLK
jgi:8-oxo-dGTP diphosphatase